MTNSDDACKASIVTPEEIEAAKGGDKMSPPSQESKPSLPHLDKGPASFYDTESGDYWIGVPTRSIDLFAATLILDAEKFRLFERYHAAALEAQKNKLIIPKGHWSQVADKLKGAGRKLGLVKA